MHRILHPTRGPSLCFLVEHLMAECCNITLYAVLLIALVKSRTRTFDSARKTALSSERCSGSGGLEAYTADSVNAVEVVRALA